MVSIRNVFTGMMVCSAAILLAGPVQAQERSAATTLETQMTWSTLANLVEAANANSKAANTRIDQSILCNKKFMAYAPGAPGADSDGCIENELIKQLTKRMDKAETDIKTTIEKLDALDARLTTEVKRIDASLVDLGNRIALLNTRVGMVEADMQALQTRMAAVENSVKNLTNRVAAVEADVANLERRVAGVESRLTTAEATIRTHTSQIATLTSDVATLKKDMDALEKLVSTLTSRVATTENKLNWISSCNSSGRLWNGTGNGCKTIDAGGSDGLSSCKLTFSETLTSEANATSARCSGSLFIGKTQQGNQYWARCLKLTCS